jgi:uncharacterized protein YegP (UPF0339 family)
MYYITKTKSKTRPFQVVNVDIGNFEVINTSQLLKSRQACKKNIIANMDTVFNDDSDLPFYVGVQDDTLKKPVSYFMNDDGDVFAPKEAEFPKYIPGRNPKKKKK